MRDDYPQSRTSVLVWLVSALVAGFVIQVLFERWLNTRFFTDALQLSALDLRQGAVWTLLTYPFLDDSVLGLVFNALSIYFLGREVLPYLGERRFLWFVGVSAVVAGLFWFSVHFSRGDALMGSSVISCALLALFACYQPNRDITLLLFFILPVTLKPKYLAGFVGGVSLLGLIASEIPGGGFASGVPHSAHLGGMVTALLYFVIIHRWEWTQPDGRVQIELPRWLRRTAKTPELSTPKFKIDLTNRADLKAEVDRILDKINSEGFGALTAEERRILDEAKDSLSRR